PADSDATDWIAARANEYLRQDLAGIKRQSTEGVLDSRCVPWDFLQNYVADLGSVVDVEAIANAGSSIGADPMGGTSVDYCGAIAQHYGLTLTVVKPEVAAIIRYMTLYTDGKIRMDCSSPHLMASLIDNRQNFDLATGNDVDADRHGIV